MVTPTFSQDATAQSDVVDVVNAALLAATPQLPLVGVLRSAGQGLVLVWLYKADVMLYTK